MIESETVFWGDNSSDFEKKNFDTSFFAFRGSFIQRGRAKGSMPCLEIYVKLSLVQFSTKIY